MLILFGKKGCVFLKSFQIFNTSSRSCTSNGRVIVNKGKPYSLQHQQGSELCAQRGVKAVVRGEQDRSLRPR